MDKRIILWILLAAVVQFFAAAERHQISPIVKVDGTAVEFYHENIYEGSEFEFEVLNPQAGTVYGWRIGGAGNDGKYLDAKGYFFNSGNGGSVLFVIRLADLENFVKEQDLSDGDFYNLDVQACVRESNGQYYPFDNLTLKIRIPENLKPLRESLPSTYILDEAETPFDECVRTGMRNMELRIKNADRRMDYHCELIAPSLYGTDVVLFSCDDDKSLFNQFLFPLSDNVWKESQKILDPESGTYYHQIGVNLYYRYGEELIPMCSRSARLRIQPPSNFCRIYDSPYFDGEPHKSDMFEFWLSNHFYDSRNYEWTVSVESSEDSSPVTAWRELGLTCHFDPTLIDWENVRAIYNEDLGVDCYKATVECKSSWGDADCMDTKIFYLYTSELPKVDPPVIPPVDPPEPMDPPTKPILKNIHFDPLVYDWEIDTILYDSILRFDMECENATGFEIQYHCREDFWNFGFPDTIKYDFGIIMEYNGSGEYEYTLVDLGDIFRIFVYNKSGYAYSDPVAVNDYIEDPEILARLYQLRDIETGIRTPYGGAESKDNDIEVLHDSIRFNDPAANITIYTVTGCKILEHYGVCDQLSTSVLPSGIYVMSYTDKNNENRTVKFTKL